MKEQRQTVFDPEGVSPHNYRKEYPDLRNIPEFEKLTDVELITVWYFSNPTSPLVEKFRDIQRRMEESHYKATGNYSRERSHKYAVDYTGGNLQNNDVLKEAIDRMGKVNLSIRLQANDIVSKIMEDFYTVVNTPLTDFKKADDQIDFNAYVASRKNVAANLDAIIQKVESGFGTKKVSDKKTSVGTNITTTYLKNKLDVGTA